MEKSLIPLLFIVAAAVYTIECEFASDIAIKPVEYAHFNVSGLQSKRQASLLKKELKKQRGVTAVSVNYTSGKASVAFFPNENNKERLKMLFETLPGIRVSDYQLEAAPNQPICPMKKVSTWFDFLK